MGKEWLPLNKTSRNVLDAEAEPGEFESGLPCIKCGGKGVVNQEEAH